MLFDLRLRLEQRSDKLAQEIQVGRYRRELAKLECRAEDVERWSLYVLQLQAELSKLTAKLTRKAG